MNWGRLIRHRRVRLTGMAAACLILVWGGFGAVTRSDWFGEKIRSRLVRELEQVTGGDVSITELRFGATRLSFEILGLEIRGGEGHDMPALLTVPEASVRLSWWSLLTSANSLDSLRIRRPLVQVVVQEDGTSNVPTPDAQLRPATLRVRQFELTEGTIIWNDRPYDAQFSGSGLRVLTTFDEKLGQTSVEAMLSGPDWGVGGWLGPPASTATVSAVLIRSGIELRRAEIRGDGYAVEAIGTLSNLQAPRFEGEYVVTAQLAALSAWLSSSFGSSADHADIAGTLRAQGSLECDSASREVRYTGRLRSEGTAPSGPFANASFNATYRGDQNRLDLPTITGRLLGGEMAARASVRNLGAVPELSATGIATGVELAAITEAARMRPLPWSGVLEASFEVQGAMPNALDVAGDVTVQPTGGPSKLPVEGIASLRYGSTTGSMTVSSLQLSTPNAQVALNGTLDLDGHASFELRAEVESKQAVERILAALQPTVALPPSAPDGRFSFQGRVLGRLGSGSDAVLDGEFAVEDFLFGGQRWKQLSLQGSLSPTRFEIRGGRLTDPAGLLELRGTLPLRDAGAVHLSVLGEDFDAAKLAQAIGIGAPIGGAVALDLEMAGTVQQPEGKGTVRLDDPRFFGERFDRLDASALYGPTGFELQNVTLSRGDSRLRGRAVLATPEQDLRFEFESNPWPLDQFDWMQLLAPGLRGSARFEVRGAGRLRAGAGMLRAFTWDGAWEVADLSMDSLELGRWTGAFHTNPEHQRIEIDWKAAMLAGTAQGRAALQQRGAAAYTGRVEFRDLSNARLAALLELPLAGSDGSITGQASFGGVLGERGSFEMRGTIDRLEAGFPVVGEEAYRIANVFPLRWGVADGALRLDSMNLSGNDSDFKIDGTVGLGGDKAVDIALDGTCNLFMLRGLIPGLDTSGLANLGMRVRGTLDGPVLEGSIEILDAALHSPGVPLGLNEINGAITFEGNQGRIENLTASSGGGSVRAAGALAFKDSRLEYRMQLRADGIRVDHPESVSSVIDGRFTLAGAGARSILNGDVLISRMSTANGLTFAELFSRLRQPEGDQSVDPMFQGMQLNVHIGAVTQLPVETSLVRNVQADFDLDLVGTVANPSMLGTIGITQGEIRLLGTHYRINRGDIRFVNPFQTEPVLNIELETRIRGVDIALVLSGPARTLDLSYRSDPPLPFHDLVNLVAVGKEPASDPSIASQRRIEQQSLVQTGADNILSQAIARPVSQRLQRFFGVSRLKVDPQIGGLEANPSARISTEQQLTNDVTLIYSYDLSSAQQQAIRIEWNPNRRWSFIVTRDQNGLVGSDVLYKVRLP